MTAPATPRLLLCCPSCGVRYELEGDQALEAMTAALRLRVYCAEADVVVLRQQLDAANAVCERLVKERDNAS